jgi:hypothetical protein
MRADMAKVIVERPRFGSRDRGKPKGYRRRQRRLGDEAPRRESMKHGLGYNGKMLNEHLGPLRRYLDSQVGRPWDKVYAEICAHIDRNSAVQDHVRDHVDGYVAVNVVEIDGVLCWGGGDWGRYGTPLTQLYGRIWYVCPRTGLLRRIRHVRRRFKPPAPPPIRYIPMGKGLQCRRIDGVWHVVTLRPLPQPEEKRTHYSEMDVVLNCPIAALVDAEAIKQYGHPVYAIAKRRLLKKELSQYPIPRAEW